MKNILRPLLSLSFLLCALAKAEEPTFIDIQAEDLPSARAQVPEAFQGELTYSEVDHLIRHLMSLGHYERLQAETNDKDQIIITGKPLRLIKTVSFKGNRKISSQELLEISNLHVSDKFDRKKILKAGEALKDLYGERGFFNTIIEVNFLRSKDGNLNVQFQIDEKNPCRIDSLTVLSSNPELNTRLEKKLNSFKRDAFTATTLEAIHEKMTRYLLANRYLRSEIQAPKMTYNSEKTRVNLQFEVNEPFRYEFSFNLIKDGGKIYDSSQDTNIKFRKISQVSNFERASLDPTSEVVDRIRKYYLSSGFPNVKVTAKVTELSENYLRRNQIDIDEGQKVKIIDFDVRGRISRAPNYYWDFIKNNSSDLIRKGYYSREDLENGYKNLITDLRNQGFLKAKIQSARIEYIGKKNEARILVIMDEGPLTQIRSIQFMGTKAFTDQELLAVLGLIQQSPLRLNEFEASLIKLKNFYQNQGYLEMYILNENDNLIEYNDKGTQASLFFKIYEGPKIRVASISVDGNTFTKTDVVLREIDIHVGDILTPEKITESTVRLNRLGIFSRVNIQTVEEGTQIADRQVVVSVSETDPGTFRLGIGVNSERGLTATGSTGVSYSNLFGTARAISARIKLGSNIAETNYLEHEFTVGYLEPFLFNSRTRGRVNFTQAESVREHDSQNQLTQIVKSDKVELLLERDFTRHIKFTWKAWSLDAREEFERNGYCLDSTPGNREKCPSKTQQVTKIGPMIDVDFRDNSFLPTQGTYSRLFVDYSHPELGSSENINFVKTEALFTHYLRLPAPRWIWANSLRGGYLSNLSDKTTSGVPVSDSFILGGLNSIRGFDGTSSGDRVPSRDELPIERSTDLLIKTDSTFYLIKSEVRFPLIGEHGGVLFYDGGAVMISGYDFRRTYHDSIGFGYRYNTPVGPVSVDLGFKIKPMPGEARSRLHFSIGTF